MLETVIKHHVRQPLGKAGVILAGLCVSSCVTINIYFPAAAAEKAADQVIDEIWQVPGNAVPGAPTAPATPQESQP